MKRMTALFVAVLLVFAAVPLAVAQDRLKVASTTSTDNTGLFAALNPPFEQMLNCRVDVIAVGTGKALAIGRGGDADIVFVHARSAEEEFVEGGYGVNRRDVMYNDFVIVGPKNDPAGIKGLKDAGEALSKIAASESTFISRGDDSGTHKKERKLWGNAGIEPEGKWYSEAGQGMGAVLQIANEKSAYALTDRGTYLAYTGKVDLVILCEGDPDLFNPYGIIAVNPAMHSHVNYILAMAYIGWVTSPEGQAIIRVFGKEKFGQPLFIPVAVP